MHTFRSNCHAAALLLFSLLVFAITVTGSKPAQALTLTYVGPAWDTSACAVHFSPSSGCQNGSLTGSVTFSGIADDYSGMIYTTPITSWNMSGGGVANLSSASNYLQQGTFSFYQGIPSSWVLTLWQDASHSYPGIGSTFNGSSGYEDAYTYDPVTGYYPSSGWANLPTGHWYNLKAIGKPKSYPKIADKTPSVFPHSEPDCPCDGSSPDARGEPIDIATGNMFMQVTDYKTVGQNPLAFIRYYNSMAGSDSGLAVTLGRNWRHNYDRYLRVISSTEVEAERPDGQVVTFLLVSSVWTPSSDVDITLTNSGSTYTLTDHDDTVETYTVSGSVGTLNSIALPNGYTQTLSYSSGLLSSVTDSYSRSLSFTYTSGLLT